LDDFPETEEEIGRYRDMKRERISGFDGRELLPSELCCELSREGGLRDSSSE
jgi:hypothetical protein